MKKHLLKRSVLAYMVWMFIFLIGCGKTQQNTNGTTTLQQEQIPTVLQDQLVAVYNSYDETQVVLYNGQVVARGYAGIIYEGNTQNAIGFYQRNLEKETETFDVYHKDGSLWKEKIPGRYACCNNNWLFHYTDEYEDMELAAINLNTGEVWNNVEKYNSVFVINDQYYFMDSMYNNKAPVVLDLNFNVVMEFKDYTEGYLFCRGDRVFINLSRVNNEQGYMYENCYYDFNNQCYTPYQTLTCINDGYWVGEYIGQSGVYDLLDEKGNIIEEAIDHTYSYYDDVMRCSYYSQYGTYELINVSTGIGESTTNYMNFEKWSGGYFCEAERNSVVRFYDKSGNKITEIYQNGDDDISAYKTDHVVVVGNGANYIVVDQQGNQRKEENPFDLEYFYMFDLDDESQDASNKRYAFNNYGNYKESENYYCFYSMIDEDGNTIIDQLNELYGAGLNGVYRARKGFEYGLIDANGNWLWKENRFSSFEEGIWYY